MMINKGRAVLPNKGEAALFNILINKQIVYTQCKLSYVFKYSICVLILNLDTSKQLLIFYYKNKITNGRL